MCLSPLSTFFNLTLSAILAMGTSSRDVGVLSPVVGLMWGLLLRVGELPVWEPCELWDWRLASFDCISRIYKISNAKTL